MSVGKLTLICFAGLVLNLIGSSIADHFNLSIYLDTSGTIFIAALGGYVPGITIGFFTNLIKALFESSEMYYCSVSIMIAIFTTFFARKGFFDSFGKVLLLIPFLTFATGTFDLLIEKFLNATSVLQSLNQFQISYKENFLNEFLDKSFSMILSFVLLKLTPPKIKRAFRLAGQRQAPLSDEMKHVIDQQNYLSSSLRTKSLLILLLSSFLVSFSIALISYLLFKNAVIDDRIKTVDGIVTIIISEINPNRVDEYINLGRNAEGYRAIEEKFYSIKNSNTNIKYIYVYKIMEDGCHVVFDLDTGTFDGDAHGEIVPFEESAYPYKDDFIAGRPIPPIISNDEYGHLLTLYKPLYDINGKCQCYAAVDYSMEILPEYTKNFTIKLMILFLGCFVFISAVGLMFVKNNIVVPVNTLAYYARNISYDNKPSRERYIEQMRGLKIKTNDEIENLYSAWLRMTENLLKYLEHLQRAKAKVADMQIKIFEIDEIAHKDSLTGIRNKVAYDEASARLNKKILKGEAKFCIVMVDVNFLKKINDTYGHEHGNIYLINACKLICSVFGVEHVYRIGGDEFVVILEDEKISLCKYFIEQFKSEMDRKNSNLLLEPWEKVSAAVGVAFYEPDRDKDCEDVFERADALMYENKLSMKAARTD